MTEMRLNRLAVDECYFKTFAKLADVAKLHKSGAKSEPTTCAEEQVNHYRSPKDAVNEGENLACISLLLPVAMTFLCKRYQLFKKYTLRGT